MRRALLVVTVTWSACGGASGPVADTLPPLRPACSADTAWNGSRCASTDRGRAALARGVAAVAAFQPETAVRELTGALAAGPHNHETLIQIHEQLGIAHAYLGDEPAAITAFDTLLALDPRHLLSYTLSPKVTFLFERVRRDRQRVPAPAVDLNWPRDLSVTQPIPLDVEVVSDARRQLARATVEVRRKGEPNYRAIDLPLAAPGTYRRVWLPPVGGNRAEVLQFHLRAYDGDGNEVRRWGSAKQPRELALGYREPLPWYRRWWAWTLAGSAAALATGVTVYALQKEPPATVGGGLGVSP